MTAPQLVDTTPLDEAYDIVAELGARDSARMLMAKRRSDGLDVVIAITQKPAGDERNALTLLAADTKVLATHGYRALVPTVEGRWLGSDAFAVVRERILDPSLRELLAQGTQLSFSRVGAILSEVHGLLAWAREQKLVHRVITADSLFIEWGTDRVRAAFVISAIPLPGAPEEEGDARTIATLAWMMLAGSTELPERSNASLAELRPDLPTRIIEDTQALLNATRTNIDGLDVAGYIAGIAMADLLKAGEIEIDRIEKELSEEQRATREQLDQERREHAELVAEQERRLAQQREQFEREVAEREQQFARERAAFEAAIAERESMLAAEREQFAHAAAREREELDARRAQIDELIAEHRELVATIPPVIIDRADPSAAVSTPFEAVPVYAAGAQKPDNRWLAIGGGATVVGILIASALAAHQRGAAPPRTAAPAPVVASPVLSIDSTAATTAKRVDTAAQGGEVAPRVDSAAVTGTRPVSADTAAVVAPRPRPRRNTAIAKRDSLSADSAAQRNPFLIPGQTRDSAPGRDSTVRRDSTGRGEAAIRRDTTVRRDTVTRRDSVVRRDTTARRDSSVRRDTSGLDTTAPGDSV